MIQTANCRFCWNCWQTVLILGKTKHMTPVCEKTTYNTHNEAQNAAHHISAKTGKGMRTYRCDNCGGLHLTTAKPKVKPRSLRGQKYKDDYSWIKQEEVKPKTPKKKNKPQQSVPLTTYKPFAYLRNNV